MEELNEIIQDEADEDRLKAERESAAMLTSAWKGLPERLAGMNVLEYSDPRGKGVRIGAFSLSRFAICQKEDTGELVLSFCNEDQDVIISEHYQSVESCKKRASCIDPQGKPVIWKKPPFD